MWSILLFSMHERKLEWNTLKKVFYFVFVENWNYFRWTLLKIIESCLLNLMKRCLVLLLKFYLRYMFSRKFETVKQTWPAFILFLNLECESSFPIVDGMMNDIKIKRWSSSLGQSALQLRHMTFKNIAILCPMWSIQCVLSISSWQVLTKDFSRSLVKMQPLMLQLHWDQ